MSTYNDASLIYYPSGYKAGTAYSLKPTDGSGDLTFTRASTATRVNESGLIEEVAANVPRLDNSQGGCSTLLLEPQRTNLALRSEEFDSASWAKVNSSVTANTTISPDGTLNADSIINNVGNNQFARIRQIPSVIIGQTYVYSCFFKRGSTNYGIIALFDGANFSAFFDLNNGTIENVSSGITTTIENFQDEWYKCSIIRTVATSSVQFLLSMSTNSSLNTSNLNDFVYIWGAQVEEGSYATSYIPTTTTSVTKTQDSAAKTGISSLIGQTEGTLYAEVYFPALTFGQSAYVSLTSGSFLNAVLIGKEPGSPDKYGFYIIASGTTIFVNTSNNLQNNFVKMAIAYKSGDWAAYLNGTLVASGTSTFTFNSPLSVLGLGPNDAATSITSEPSNVREVMTFPTRKSNAELATLTTL